MKGTKTIEFDGDKITFRFTAGVIEDLQEYAEQNDVAPEDLDNKIKHQRVMLALMELYGEDSDKAARDPKIIEKAVEKGLKYKTMDFDTILGVLDSLGVEAEGKVKKAAEKKT
ncbi:hypothetical protein [Gracilimonas sp.]|uniref:hypothetical protein n=1 Tax=Gracilimonas sp. TaxID=1974203 RepID=UPI0028717BD9|nr:hypothetical protein [Gracilimonas sp.]